MNKLLTTVFALAVTSVTLLASAQDLTGDAKAGERKNAMCVGCHGIQGYQASFPEIYKVPKIAGQGAKYIVSALNAYKKSERKHPTMHAVAYSLSDQDMADLGAYYSTLGVQAGATAPEQLSRTPSPEVAALLTKGNCVSCHGANLAKPIDPTYPIIAGQHADYLFVALKAYKTENNRIVGRGNAIMGGIAKQFSNAELKALAGYVATADTPLKTVGESRFR